MRGRLLLSFFLFGCVGEAGELRLQPPPPFDAGFVEPWPKDAGPRDVGVYDSGVDAGLEPVEDAGTVAATCRDDLDVELGDGEIEFADISPAYDYALYSADGVMRVHRLDTGRLVRSIRDARWAAFSPDGRHFAMIQQGIFMVYATTGGARMTIDGACEASLVRRDTVLVACGRSTTVVSMAGRPRVVGTLSSSMPVVLPAPDRSAIAWLDDTASGECYTKKASRRTLPVMHATLPDFTVRRLHSALTGLLFRVDRSSVLAFGDLSCRGARAWQLVEETNGHGEKVGSEIPMPPTEHLVRDARNRLVSRVDRSFTTLEDAYLAGGDGGPLVYQYLDGAEGGLKTLSVATPTSAASVPHPALLLRAADGRPYIVHATLDGDVARVVHPAAPRPQYETMVLVAGEGVELRPTPGREDAVAIVGTPDGRRQAFVIGIEDAAYVGSLFDTFLGFAPGRRAILVRDGEIMRRIDLDETSPTRFVADGVSDRGVITDDEGCYVLYEARGRVSVRSLP